MNALLFDACWLVGGILGGMVLFKGMHAGWFTVSKKPAEPEWLTDRRNPLGAAADPLHFQPAPSLEGPYPNGSVPYGDSNERPESPELRAKRFACAAKNHHPRQYDGSWCMGFGYVCSRCQMHADPVPKVQLQEMCDALNRLPPDEQQMAAARLSNGGPKGFKKAQQRIVP